MKYRIISVGKIREPFYRDGIKEYLKRLGPYINVELIDGLEEKINPRASEKELGRLLEKERERIMKLIGNDELIILLDIQGKSLTSEEFAQQIEAWNISGVNCVNLVLGGAFGLDDILKEKADLLISFSKMTYPHQMAVLILCEQLYRGCKILKGEPYHH